jgi:DNA-binding transcriptional LysR family regulator
MIVFERSSGGVRAAPAGRDFLRTARSILEQAEMLVTNSRSTGRASLDGWRLASTRHCRLGTFARR